MIKLHCRGGVQTINKLQTGQIAFDLGWDFVPKYYPKIEDSRQRDQIKQALRSHKQNIVEGPSERSLSSKLKHYDVAKASGRLWRTLRTSFYSPSSFDKSSNRGIGRIRRKRRIRSNR